MKIFTEELNLGLDIFKFKLKLSRGICFRIKDCYYNNYYWDDFGTHIQVSTYITDDELKNCVGTEIEFALNRIKESNSIMSFLYGFYFETQNNGINYKNDIDEVIHLENLKKTVNCIRIKNFNNECKNFNETKVILFDKCCKLFSNGSYLMYKYDMFDDAILNLVKVMETLSTLYWTNSIRPVLSDDVTNSFKKILAEYFCENYNDSMHKNKLNTILDEYVGNVTLKSKLNKFMINKGIKLTYNGVDDISVFIKQLVKYRNDVAHGNTIYLSNDQKLDLCFIASMLSLETISYYFFEKQYSKIGFNRTIEQ